MEKPKISKQELNIIISNYLTQLSQYSVYIVGIRGYYGNMGKPGNDRGIYDDAIIVVGNDYFETYNANTDPSIFKPGIAKLIPGIHFYKQGLHGISKKHPYPAFRPATDGEFLPVTRDGQTGILRAQAINIHRGGFNTTSSEGCQTVYPLQWDKMQGETYALMNANNQKVIPYVLVEKT